MSEGDGTPAERVATGSGWVSGGERDAFRNYKSLIGNIDAVEPRILSPYHTPQSLECTRNGSVSEDEVAALSWPSDSLTYTSDCKILSKLALLTKRSEGVVELGSAMS